MHISHRRKVQNAQNSVRLVEDYPAKSDQGIYAGARIKGLRFSLSFLLICSLLIAGCATFDVQKANDLRSSEQDKQDPEHTFYFVGGMGEVPLNSESPLLKQLQKTLAEAGPKSTLVFTGDNITENSEQWETNKALLEREIKLAKGFKGNTIFLPGNNEWKSYDADKMEKAEDYIKELDLSNIQVEPNNGCAIENFSVNDNLELILVDSKWFITNWSRISGINRKCTDINTRRRFIEELEDKIGDAQDKNILIVMHHPVFSNGKFAGKTTVKDHLLPLPVLGTIKEGIDDLSGFNPDRLSSMRYGYLRVLVSALAQDSDRITLVSGHEESLQYLEGGGLHQLIVGSVAKKAATKRSEDRINTYGGSLPYEGKFTYGEKGFAKLEYFKDGSSKVTFITEEDRLAPISILPPFPEKNLMEQFPETRGDSVTSSVWTDPNDLNKPGFYRFLWGERYRDYFGESVTAPIAMLDTLYGGLEVTKTGGGHQSYSIRLEDKDGKEYSMRSLRKNALKFLKFKVKGIAYTGNNYEGTVVEEFINDFFTTAHPYMQLVINPLARAVDVNHSDPYLYYIPKQEALGELNEEFGGEMYFIEPRPSEEQVNNKGYRRAIDERGEVKEFESTTDMLEKIKEDESYSIDQRDFIRARIFDMLIGDWDRHQDQWRWIEYEKDDDNKVFIPIPRDRDNAFPRFDGVGMDLVQMFVPASRRFQSYGPDIKSVKWLNMGGNRLDRAVLNQFPAEVWEEEARYIQEHLSPEIIANAFDRLPQEVQDSTAKRIAADLQTRLKQLPKYARQYSEYLDRMVALKGTEKDDKFTITRNEDGSTRILIQRLLSDEKNEVMYDRTFDPEITKEIWIYGLSDDDEFEVAGAGKAKIMIRLIGGYGKDSFRITNDDELKVYDWKDEETVFTEETPDKQFSDLYETNTFHWRYFEPNFNVLAPNLGFRTDDGFFIGARNTFTDNGFNGNPFRQQHSLSANYYFAFRALELSYQGIWANIFPSWNFELQAYHTNNRFTTNFFGIGNETVNNEDNFGRDYYRSRMQVTKASAGISYHSLKIRGLFESYKVQEMENRLFTPDNLGETVFDDQYYVGAETSLSYENKNAPDFPSKALSFGLTGGYKWNTDLGDVKFGYVAFDLGFAHQLIPSGGIVLASKAEVKTNFGEDYFFYHAPSIGGDNGLRGYRDQRFSGKTYFYQSSDLRFRVLKTMTPVAPINAGFYGGFDYGRVWTPEQNSSEWHTSQGIGIWLSGYNFLTVQGGFFNSDEGNLIQVGLGFDF
ncbi:ShlB/FhaC/HecB family hemolysin secretion/activation protein [Zeaxanthinibacter sp. PT1]|uniref:metallophosphoesterase n=1 Tax=Zeaxanthinibacter TaxID=561554 RepID=UPI00234A6F81|nr:metallophosphoesterase [Zeaxanthinibacter sp. PT1]MDC6351145.1 ShlB/FhaC/HecB family hemolysin secretion/activation protein [Zeaxanthinibacter sp. PT1]